MIDVEIRVCGETVKTFKNVSIKKAADLFNRGYAGEGYAAVVYKDGRRMNVKECMQLFLTSKVMQYDTYNRSKNIREELEALG